MASLATILAVLCAAAVQADEHRAVFDIAEDRFLAGGEITHEGASADDLFMAGETVRVASPAEGDALLAGRRITVAAPVAGDLYAAGAAIRLEEPIGGDATLMGYEIETGEIAGDLRATGSRVTITGPVAGYAILAGERLRIEGRIAGPVHLGARRVSFGEDARIDGPLVLYEDEPGEIEVPASVLDPARIERREIERWEMDTEEFRPNPGGILAAFLGGVLVLTAIAVLVAALVPEALAEMRRRILDRPFATLWLGFLAQSVLVGAGLLLALTLVGVLLTPAAFLVAALTGVAGYVVGVYAFGVGLVQAVGRPEPASIGPKALAAGVGALVAGLIGLIPLLGWLFMLALAFAGIGALAERLFRPRFFARSMP
ncbi:MAG: hypothetical protein ACLFRU_03040 [Paracoccaceae bacterium]